MIRKTNAIDCGAFTEGSTQQTFRKKFLSLNVAAILSGVSMSFLASGSVVAQEDKPEIQNRLGIEEVVFVVSGIRASQRRAIDIKRDASTMLDAISAEDVSKFPDKNVTEALQRVTGIQISRDFGEGAGINIRGMESDLNRIEFDGVTALGNGVRRVNLTDTASELVKVLRVIKGSEASITEGGIGGTVQIEMRKANDFDDHFFSVAFENEYNDLNQESSPDLNLTGVYKVTDDFGLMANINLSKKNTVIHTLRNTEWARWADYDNSPEKTVVDPDYADIGSVEECSSQYGPNGTAPSQGSESECLQQWWDFGPGLPRYGNWSREENRISSNIGFGWQATEQLALYGDYTYNERDRFATDYNLQFDTSSPRAIERDSVVVDENHRLREFTSAYAGVANRTLKFDWFEKRSFVKFGADYISDSYDVKGFVAFSESFQDIDSRDTTISSRGVAGVRVALDGRGFPEFDLTSGYRFQDPDAQSPGEFERVDINDPASYNGQASFVYKPTVQDQSEGSAKIDFNYHFDDGLFVSSIRTGVRWAQQNLKSESFDLRIARDVGVSYEQLDSDGNTITDQNGNPLLDEWTQEDQTALLTGALERTPDFFPTYDVGVGTLRNFQAVNTGILQDRLETIAATTVSRNTLAPNTGKYDIEENTYAAYVQVDFEQEIGDMLFWGNAGVRYVQTDTLSEGDVTIESVYDIGADNSAIIWDQDANGRVDPNAAPPSYTEADITDSNGNRYGTAEVRTFRGRDTSEGSYDDILPSINLNLSIVPSVLNLYAGAAQVMSRPNIGALNINANCRRFATLDSREDATIRNSCNAGNPNIEPYRATQTDIAIMWYPNDDSLVSASYFTKKLTNYLGDSQTSRDLELFAGGENAGFLYDVTQPANIEGVSTRGIELQARTMLTMLPAPYNNFGFDANYTYMTADDIPYVNQLDGSELPLLGQSENSFNITGFYEDGALTVRAAYNFRDTYLRDAADRGGNPVFVDSAGHLDAKISYEFGGLGLTVFADARNILGEVRLEKAGEGQLSDLQWPGRTFAIGISYTM